MIYYDKINGYAMPRHDVAPESKGEKWCLEFCKYIYGSHWGSWLAKKQTRFPYLKALADGKQDYTGYMRDFLDSHSDSVNDASFTMEMDKETGQLRRTDSNAAFTHIDFKQVFNPAPAIRNTLIGIFSTQNHDITVDCVDSHSSELKKDMEFVMKSKMMFKDLYQSWETFTGVQQQEAIPQSIEELALYGNMGGFRLPYEVGSEVIVKHTERISDIEQIKRDVIDDAIMYNIYATMDTIDYVNRVVKYDYVDPNYLIMPYSRDKNCKDIPFWAYQKEYTITQLRSETGWSEDVIREIAAKWNGRDGVNPVAIDSLTTIDEYRNNICNYNDVIVVVMINEFRTVNSYYKTTVTQKDGNTFSVDEEFTDGKKRYSKGIKETENSKRETSKTDHICYYTAKWVVGTDRVFSYGQKYDEAYNFANSEPEASLHCHYENGKSIIEVIEPMLHQCQQLYLRYQNDIIMSPPAVGIAIEVGALNDLEFGNTKLKPVDTFRIYTQKHKLIYQLKPPTVPGQKDQYVNTKPYELLKGGIAPAVDDFVMGMSNVYNQISTLTGIDRFTMNSITPENDTQATAIKSAIASTKDTLKPIYSGWVSVYERMSNAAILRGISLCQEENCGYEKVIGRAKLLAMRSAGNTPPAEMGVKAVARPTEAERKEIRDAAQAAMMGGKNGIPAITMSEYLLIFHRLMIGDSLNDIRAYIAYKERQRDDKDAQIAQQATQMNTQSNLMAEKAKMERDLEFDNQKTSNLIKVKFYETLFESMLQKQGAEEELQKMGTQMGFDMAKTMNEQQGMMANGQQMVQDTSQAPQPPMQ